VAGTLATAQTASISFVPPLPGGQPFTIAYAGTPDGQFVVGYSGSTQGAQAYRWNRVTGQIDALGYLGNVDWFRSKAYAVSDDGSIVVGRSDTSDHAHPIPRAFKWTPQTGMVALPYASTTHQLGPQGNAAVSVSADGTVIVGRFESYATGADGTQYYPAIMHEWCQWTPSGVTLLPPTGVARSGLISAVSADGTSVVGFVSDSLQATLVSGSTSTPLGTLAGGHRAEPTAISRDGGTVVGWADTLDPDGVVRFHGFRWTAAAGMTDLGRLAGVNGPSRAASVSTDGAVIVGGQLGHALIWDAGGLRDLSTVLTTQYGVDLQGKELREATWVSPDGTWIIGNADDVTGPSITLGWIAHLPRQ
jgi:probable HAF family extracellular repeat protein